MAEVTEQLLKKPTCFVLMPIADTPGYDPGHFSRVYEHVLKPAIAAAGYIPLRADDTVKTDYIVVGIIQRIVDSEMVLCDISSRNPNVMYELGIRHAFNKPVALIKDKRTEKIFDIQGLRYTEYDESLRIDAVTKDTLKIKSAIEETASSKAKDTNSIVHLAGLKTAEVPASQTISPDTELILTAIGALEHRIDDIEGRDIDNTVNRVVGSTLRTPTGVYPLAEHLYVDGNHIGQLIGTNPRKQTVTLKTETGDMIEVGARSQTMKSVDNIPF